MARCRTLPLLIAVSALVNGYPQNSTDSLPAPKALYEGKFFLGDYRVNQPLLDGQKGILIGGVTGFALGLPMTLKGISRNDDLAGLPSLLGSILGAGLGGLIGMLHGFHHGIQLEEKDNEDLDFRARYRRFGFEWRGATGIDDFQEEYAALWTLRKWKRNPRYLDELKLGLGISNRFNMEEREMFLSGQKNWLREELISPVTFLDAGLIWGKGYGNLRRSNVFWPLLRLGVGFKANAWDLIQGHVLVTYNVIPATTYFHSVPLEKHVAISVGLSSYCF